MDDKTGQVRVEAVQLANGEILTEVTVPALQMYLDETELERFITILEHALDFLKGGTSVQ